jgi:hypothetical protein
VRPSNTQRLQARREAVSAAHVVGNLGDAARMCFHMMPLSTMSLWPSTVAVPWDEVQHLLCSEDPTFFGTINRLDCGQDSSGYTDISFLQVLTSARAAVFALSPYPK